MQDCHSEADEEASLLTKTKRKGFVQKRFFFKGKGKDGQKEEIIFTIKFRG